MNLQLLIPSLFWPETSAASPPEIYQDLPLPALATLLAKGVRTTESESQGMEAWLCRVFNIEKQLDWPVAPITLAADSVAVGRVTPAIANDGGCDPPYWLRADPIHLRIERGQIVLADSQIFRISPEEAQEFTALLNRHFAGNNLTLLPLHPDRWYLRLAKTPALQTHPLSQVAGKNINHLLPSGADSMAWHGVFNEIQMLLHEHPLNQAREARGELAINSVWLWGGGIMPTVERNVYTKAWSNDVLTRALALASHTDFSELPPAANAWLQSAGCGNHLLVLDSLSGKTQYGDAYGWRESLKQLEHDWFAPLLAGLKQGRINRLTITAIGEHGSRNFSVNRGDLWKFWRTQKPLYAYATMNYME